MLCLVTWREIDPKSTGIFVVITMSCIRRSVKRDVLNPLLTILERSLWPCILRRGLGDRLIYVRLLIVGYIAHNLAETFQKRFCLMACGDFVPRRLAPFLEEQLVVPEVAGEVF